MSAFTIKPATRQGLILLMGLWGGTGSGKTKSALLLARGIAGPKGRVAIVDTEHKRATYHKDSIPGGFNHIEFNEPYSPERYLEALEFLEANADAGVIDSLTHLWEGPEGILDLHEQVLDRMCKGKQDWSERERLNWPAWREPKARYKPVRDKILRFKIPLICCLRGEEKTRLIRDERGKNTVVTDLNTSPVFDKKFIFEMHVAVETVQYDGKGGFIRFPHPHAKVSNEELRTILPRAEMEQLTVEHGAALARWCAGGDKLEAPSQSTGTAAPSDSPTVKKLKRELWEATTTKHHGDKAKLQQWLVDEMCMDPSATLEEMDENELQSVLALAKKKLNQSKI